MSQLAADDRNYSKSSNIIDLFLSNTTKTNNNITNYPTNFQHQPSQYNETSHYSSHHNQNNNKRDFQEQNKYNQTKIHSNKFDFQPVLPENIESDNNYLNLQEPQKDFSIFGQIISANNNYSENRKNNYTNVKKNMQNYKSISPFSHDGDQLSMKKSRSSYKISTRGKNNENNPNDEDYSIAANNSYKKTIAQKNTNETFHNASISVLTNKDFILKSFVSNRPIFHQNPINNVYN